jgi:hypothetical protein
MELKKKDLMYIHHSKNRLQRARTPETAQQMVVAATAFLDCLEAVLS